MLMSLLPQIVALRPCSPNKLAALGGAGTQGVGACVGRVLSSGTLLLLGQES